MSADEKALLGKTAFIGGSYTGNGASTRAISLGFSPGFLVVYPVSRCFVETNWSSSVQLVMGGMAGPDGSTQGVSRTSDGFQVSHSTAAANGKSIRLNDTGVTYGWIAFR